MIYKQKNTGVCSISTEVEIDENNIIKNVVVLGGCDGNLKGISSLLIGMKAQDAIEKMKDITCGRRSTSCPAQIAKCLETAVQNNK